jgi:adenylate cyclase
MSRDIAEIEDSTATRESAGAIQLPVGGTAPPAGDAPKQRRMYLFAEIRHRGVLRIATGYLIVSWLVLEVGHTLFNVFELPHAGLQFVFVLLALGFPIALLGAWQGWIGRGPESDPHAATGTASTHSGGGGSFHEGPWLAAVFGIVAVFAVAVAIGVRFLGMGHSSPTSEHDFGTSAIEASTTAGKPTAERSEPANTAANNKSIAVLPFSDLSEKKDQEYFADGISAEILDRLARVPSLSVIGRTSSFQFKDKIDDLRAIGNQLGAVYLLEGSVQKSGKTVRLTARLIDSRTGTQKWSETYEREVTDALNVQESVAAGVARALQVTIDVDSSSGKPTIKNTDAYDLYLRGRNAFDRQDPAGLEAATVYFQQALDLDPSFAAAAAYLAVTRICQVIPGFVPKRDGLDRARKEAELAVRLDPNLPDAHAALGSAAFLDWDWITARNELSRALTLQPRNAIALYSSAGLASLLGKTDQAIQYVRADIAVDPLSPNAHELLGMILFADGRADEAEASLEEALRISPMYIDAQYELALVLISRSRFQQALSLLNGLPDGDDDLDRMMVSAALSFAMGQKLKSDAVLDKLKRRGTDIWAFGIASAYAMRGQKDEAFAWLEQSRLRKDIDFISITLEPAMTTLRTDPRYKALLGRLGLPNEPAIDSSTK